MLYAPYLILSHCHKEFSPMETDEKHSGDPGNKINDDSNRSIGFLLPPPPVSSLCTRSRCQMAK